MVEGSFFFFFGGVGFGFDSCAVVVEEIDCFFNQGVRI